MSEQTYHTTTEQVRDMESQAAQARGGNVPADSEAALLQSKHAKTQPSKSEKIDRAQANLPLPDDPPTASDFNSADGRTVNVGSGGVQDDIAKEMAKGADSGLREPATAASSVRVDGDELKKNTAP